VHEPLHYIACLAQGKQPVLTIFSLPQNVNCAGADAFSPAGMLPFFAAPYLADLAELIALAFVNRKGLSLKIVPIVAFFDFYSNFSASKVIGDNFDFNFIHAINPAAEIMLSAAIVLVWVVFFWVDLYYEKTSPKGTKTQRDSRIPHRDK